FGLSAARWQEWSGRNFASGQCVALQPYSMYGKKAHRCHCANGLVSTADTRVVRSPPDDNRVYLIYFGFCSALVLCRLICAVRLSIHASHCCGERAKGPSAPPEPGPYAPHTAPPNTADMGFRPLKS